MIEITAQHLLDIEASMNKLNAQKSKLSLDKKEIELKLSVVKNTIRSSGKLSQYEYNNLCKDQNKYKADIINIEKALAEIQLEIRKKSELKETLRLDKKQQNVKEIKTNLISLRDKYMNFASDKSRISSMRVMSSTFAEELENLIKQI